MNEHPSDATRIEDQAATWVLRQDRGLTAPEQDEFMQWLADDPRHGEVLARQRQNWARLDLLGQWKPEHSSRPNRDLLAPPDEVATESRPRWRPWLALAAAVAVAFVGFIFWPRAGAPAEERPPQAIAAIESRTLADGSVVELNRGAAIAVRFTPTERRVTVERGEAHFTVAKNAARPFIVSAGGVDVQAVGTAFNLRLGHSAVEVLVTEGRVRVDQEAAGGGKREVVVPALDRGQRTLVALGAPTPVPARIAPVSDEQMAQLLAWQPRLLEFTSAPLRSVVAEFNRCNAPLHLVVADSDLAEVEVSASLRSDNVEGFLRLLEAGFGVRVERSGDTIRLRRR